MLKLEYLIVLGEFLTKFADSCKLSSRSIQAKFYISAKRTIYLTASVSRTCLNNIVLRSVPLSCCFLFVVMVGELCPQVVSLFVVRF